MGCHEDAFVSAVNPLCCFAVFGGKIIPRRNHTGFRIRISEPLCTVFLKLKGNLQLQICNSAHKRLIICYNGIVSKGKPPKQSTVNEKENAP